MIGPSLRVPALVSVAARASDDTVHIRPLDPAAPAAQGSGAVLCGAPIDAFYCQAIRALDTEYPSVRIDDVDTPICPDCSAAFKAWASGQPPARPSRK